MKHEKNNIIFDFIMKIEFNLFKNDKIGLI